MGKLQNALAFIRKKTDFVPRVAVVLGSGLGDFAESIKKVTEVDYASIPDFPTSTVSGHRGRFLFGFVGETPVALMQGRVHYYEGYPMEDVVMPIRLLGLLGAKTLILTNAAGGICESFSPGDFMLIRDQISSFVPSPLIGPNEEALGVRFPDMSEIYDVSVCDHIRAAAKELELPLREGVYLQCAGPQYETPAEIRAFGLLGADAVGMSTACEAVAARHMGMRVGGISLISNMAAGICKTPLAHEEVKEMANRVSRDFAALLNKVLERL